jgi:hypothetical protein
MTLALFIAIFFPIILVFLIIFSGKHWKAEQEKARERRMAEHRLNARLFRLNI